MAVATVVLTYQTFPATVGPPATPPMYTAALFSAAQLLPGVVNWKVEILTIAGIPPAIVSVRVHNLTAGTAIDYTFTNAAGPPTTTSTSWIPGAVVTVAEPVAPPPAGLNPALHVGAYCLITTTNTGAVLGRASLTYDEDVSWTQATGGNYTINTAWGAVDILLVGFTAFMAYNETTDTMFWQETVAAWDLVQGDWVTFQVDSVADIAGNAIPVGSPETANCVVLAPTIAIGP